jgi:hypothetical protein
MYVPREQIRKGQRYLVNVSRDIGAPLPIELVIFLVPPKGPIRGTDNKGEVHLFWPDKIEARLFSEDEVDPPINIFDLRFGQSKDEVYVVCKSECKRTKGTLKTYAGVMELIRNIQNGSVNVDSIKWIKYAEA